MLSRLVSGAILGAVNGTDEDIAEGRELTLDKVECVTFALGFGRVVPGVPFRLFTYDPPFARGEPRSFLPPAAFDFAKAS